MAIPKKEDAIPLQVTLNLWHGFEAHGGAPIKKLPQSVSTEFWIPGNPMAKRQGYPQVVGKSKPRAIIAPDKANKKREMFIREEVMRQIELHYSYLIPYLPVVRGYAEVRVYALMANPASNPRPKGTPHTDTPDDENIMKLVKDAVGCRQDYSVIGGSLIYWDDQAITNSKVWKEYIDITPGLPVSYPREPGVLFAVDLHPFG